MSGKELEPEDFLHQYMPAKKNDKKIKVYNFRFDLKNIIVLRIFGTSRYVYVKYDKNTITNLESLRNKIEWKYIGDLE